MAFYVLYALGSRYISSRLLCSCCFFMFLGSTVRSYARRFFPAFAAWVAGFLLRYKCSSSNNNIMYIVVKSERDVLDNGSYG